MVVDDPFQPDPEPAGGTLPVGPGGAADAPHQARTTERSGSGTSTDTAVDAVPMPRGRVRLVAHDRELSPARRPSRHAHFNLGSTRSSSAPAQRVQFNHDHVITVSPPAAVPVDGPDLDHVNDALEDYRTEQGHDHSYARPASTTSMASMLNSEEDYDYRLDKDPVPDDDDRTDGEGDKPEKAGQEESGWRETEEHRLHQVLDNNASSHIHGGYVQLGETDGLPSRPDEDETADLRTAANIVRSHTGGHKWSILRRRVRNGGVKPDAEKAGGASAAVSSAVNNEKQGLEPPSEEPQRINAPLNAPPGVSGNSVLSSLLALYNQPHPESLATSAATTPQSSRPPSPTSDASTPPPNRPWFWRRKSGTPPPTGVPPNSSDRTPMFGEKHRQKSQTSFIEREEKRAKSPRSLGALQRHIEELREDRPKAARSGAGVFGALVQNTAGMAAAAVPSASTLMPAAKRPGYHLTRYSLNDELPRAKLMPPSRPSSASGFASLARRHSGTPTQSRPSSTIGLNETASDYLEAKSYPASVYSASASEPGELREAKSSDNLLMMKPKPKSPKGPIPNPLNMKAVKSAENWLSRKSTEDLTRLSEEERRKKALAAERKKQKKAREARKKQEVFIIRHVAAILARQQFILKLGRALMMFGSPTHRIETQIQATAKVLDISAQVVYLPNIMLISFSDEAMHTSETKFLKQTSTLDLDKLLATHNLYWEVVHDRMSVDDANKELDRLMTIPPLYSWWQMVIIGAFCSAIIVIPSYYGSLLDALMAAPLGMLLMIVQMFAAKNDLFSGVFEIAIATIISFLAAALGDTRFFCYTALVSGGIVMILPGYIVLTGSLEIASRNITAGAVRMGYSVIYSLFLGFGISMGAEVYMKIRNRTEVTNATDYTCRATHYPPGGSPWYLHTPSSNWYYLCVPTFAFFLSLSSQQPILRKETPIMIAFACAGWVTNFFAAKAFKGRNDIVSAIGSFCVGILGNIYGRFFSNGASFPVMVTGILMQLPSGLKEGGLFNFAADTKHGTFSQYSSGFSVAAQLISVAIGLTVGLFMAAVLTNPFGGSRRRGAGIFSF